MKNILSLLIILIGLTSCKDSPKRHSAPEETSSSIDDSVEMTEEQKNLKKYAIPIENLSELSDKIYDEISNFEIW